MNFTLFVTALLTGLAFVGVVTVLAKLISPRSYNAQKEEAILFLMFDVETMFLFPWAVVMRSLGPAGLFSVLFFLFILVLGLAYAWRKGALKWQ